MQYYREYPKKFLLLSDMFNGDFHEKGKKVFIAAYE